MNRIFFLILFFLVPLSSARAQSFSQDPYEATLPLFDHDRELGDLKAFLKGEEILSVDRDSLIEVLKSSIKPDTIESLKKLPKEIRPELLPFPLKLNAQEFKLETKLNLDQRAREKIGLKQSLDDEESQALHPAPFGGAINYRLEKNWGAETLGGNNFNGQFNSFMNINSLVLENQSYYQSQNTPEWSRGDTRLVKDFEKQQIRTQVGDVYPLVQGFMFARPLGGVNIQRNFSLNPYRLPFPTGTQNFALKSRSMVKYFVNGALVKTEFLPAGNYTARDIPLNNGLNTILIEATDDLGIKQVFIFRSSASINLLNQGESRFDLSYGTPFLDNALKRTYTEEDGKVFSGFFQYGFSSEFSGSLYLQNQSSFNLLGSEVIQATPVGNFNLGHAESRDEFSKGSANSLTYQYVSQGVRWFDSHSLGLRYENRSDNFKITLRDLSSTIQNYYSGNYTLPVAGVMTASLGANYGDVRNNDLDNRYGYDLTLSFRVLDHHNISFFMGRNRDEFKRWNDVAYAFLTITFPESNDFVSALYDQQQKSTKLTYLKDNQNRLYNVRAQASTETTSSNQFGEMDLNYPTTMGDLGGRVTANHSVKDNVTYSKGNVRLNQSFVFAYQEKEWGVGFSRPIPGSFVIFKPSKNLKEQKIALKSTSPFNEAESGLFDEITFSNLLAYQYRDVQLDPTFLEEGTSLVKEKFILYPTYRSAHLIKLEDKGSLMLKGQLLGPQGRPLSLQVGHIGDTTFFTNRQGAFFIEGIEPGEYKLTLEGSDEEKLIHLRKDELGVKDLGPLKFEESP